MLCKSIKSLWHLCWSVCQQPRCKETEWEGTVFHTIRQLTFIPGCYSEHVLQRAYFPALSSYLAEKLTETERHLKEQNQGLWTAMDSLRNITWVSGRDLCLAQDKETWPCFLSNSSEFLSSSVHTSHSSWFVLFLRFYWTGFWHLDRVNGSSLSFFRYPG